MSLDHIYCFNQNELFLDQTKVYRDLLELQCIETFAKKTIDLCNTTVFDTHLKQYFVIQGVFQNFAQKVYY